MSNLTVYVYDEERDEEIRFVLTRWSYDPGRPSTFHEEGSPEEFEALDGYAIREIRDPRTLKHIHNQRIDRPFRVLWSRYGDDAAALEAARQAAGNDSYDAAGLAFEESRWE